MIKATFNGAEREFRVDNAQQFEACIGGSAVAMLKRFTSGTWTADDVALVLSYGLHGPSKEASVAWRFARTARASGLPMPPIPYKPHPDVEAAVNVEGAGNLAALAADILTDIIFREVPAVDNEEAADDAG